MNKLKQLILFFALLTSSNLLGQFASEFNYVASLSSPVIGEYSLSGIFTNVENLGDPDYTATNVLADGSHYFIDSEGQPFVIVNKPSPSPLEIEVDNIDGNSFTPAPGVGQLTSINSENNQYYTTSGVSKGLLTKLQRINTDRIRFNSIIPTLDDTSTISSLYKGAITYVEDTDESWSYNGNNWFLPSGGSDSRVDDILVDIEDINNTLQTVNTSKIDIDFATEEYSGVLIETTSRKRYKLTDKVPDGFNGGIADTLFYIPVQMTDTITNLAFESEEMVERVLHGLTVYNGNAETSLTGAFYEGSPLAKWTHGTVSGTAGRLYFRTSREMVSGDTITVSFYARSVRDATEELVIQAGTGGTGYSITAEETNTIGPVLKRYVYQLETSATIPSNSSRWVKLEGFDGEIEITKLMINEGSTPGIYYKTEYPSLNSESIFAEYVPEEPVLHLGRLPNLSYVSDSDILENAQQFSEVHDYRYSLIQAESRAYKLDTTFTLHENIYFNGAESGSSQVRENSVTEAVFGTIFETNFDSKIPVVTIEQPEGTSGPHNDSGFSNVAVKLTDTVSTVFNIYEVNGFHMKNINIFNGSGDRTEVLADTLMAYRAGPTSDMYTNEIRFFDATGTSCDVGIVYEGRGYGTDMSDMLMSRANNSLIINRGYFKCERAVWQAGKGPIVTSYNGGRAEFLQLYTEEADSTLIVLDDSYFTCIDCRLNLDAGQNIFEVTNGSSVILKEGIIQGGGDASFDETTKILSFEDVRSSSSIYNYDISPSLLDTRTRISNNRDVTTGVLYPSISPSTTLIHSKLKESGAEELTLQSIVIGNTTLVGNNQNLLENSFRVGDAGDEYLTGGGTDSVVIQSLAGIDQLGNSNATLVYWQGKDIGASGTTSWFNRAYDESDINVGDALTFSIYVKPTAGYPVGELFMIGRPGANGDDFNITLPANLPDDEFTRLDYTIYMTESDQVDIDGGMTFRLNYNENSNFAANDSLWIGGMSLVKGEHPLGYVETTSSVNNTEANIHNESYVNFKGGIRVGETDEDIYHTGNTVSGVQLISGDVGDGQTVVVTPGLTGMDTATIIWGVEGSLSLDSDEVTAIITARTSTTITFSLKDALESGETLNLHWTVKTL